MTVFKNSLTNRVLISIVRHTKRPETVILLVKTTPDTYPKLHKRNAFYKPCYPAGTCDKQALKLNNSLADPFRGGFSPHNSIANAAHR